MYLPYAHLPGGFSPNDGTIDFYGRINALIRPEMRVLDLGAGRAGWFEDDPVTYRRELRLLKGKVAEVVAADVDDAVMQNRSSDRNVLIENGRIPVPDASFDVVVADYVLEHIVDVPAFRAEIDRVLRPGGHFCARTPHKWSYVSILARLSGNSRHTRILSRAQPTRKEIDVFPTAYRLNTPGAIAASFAGYASQSFVYRTDPAYFFGSRAVYGVLSLLHRVMPVALCGSFFVFLRKPDSRASPT